jgi:hypothetical protein
LGSGQLAGYAGAGDVWYPQPAPKNHPWRPSSRLIPVAGFDGAGLRRKTEPTRATATRLFPAWPSILGVRAACSLPRRPALVCLRVVRARWIARSKKTHG